MDSQVKPWCSRDTSVPRSQYTRQNSNDYQSDVDVQGYTGFSLSADRQRMSLHHFLIICQKVIINAFQRLHGLLVSFWAVSPAVTSVAEVLHEDQDLWMWGFLQVSLKASSTYTSWLGDLQQTPMTAQLICWCAHQTSVTSSQLAHCPHAAHLPRKTSILSHHSLTEGA